MSGFGSTNSDTYLLRLRSCFLPFYSSDWCTVTSASDDTDVNALTGRVNEPAADMKQLTRLAEGLGCYGRCGSSSLMNVNAPHSVSFVPAPYSVAECVPNARF